ncbi:MAG: DUF3987 domain-containing protein, partial [Gallionellaceae bacterium]
DNPEKWCNIDRFPNATAKQRVQTIFERLDSMRFPTSDEDIPALRFNTEAQAVFDKWRVELEAKVTNETSGMIEAHLAKYRSLMPSIALLLHLADIADHKGMLTPVSVDAATRAAAWCKYLETHARRIYGMQSLDKVEGATTLLQKLLRNDVQSPFRARDVYHGKHWSRLTTATEAEAACRVLCDYDYIRAEDVKNSAGGRPTIEYTLNPKAVKKTAKG